MDSETNQRVFTFRHKLESVWGEVLFTFLAWGKNIDGFLLWEGVWVKISYHGVALYGAKELWLRWIDLNTLCCHSQNCISHTFNLAASGYTMQLHRYALTFISIDIYSIDSIDSCSAGHNNNTDLYQQQQQHESEAASELMGLLLGRTTTWINDNGDDNNNNKNNNRNMNL